MLTQVGVMGLMEAPPCCPHPPTLSPWGVDDRGESEWEGSWNSQSFQEHRLTFLELKEALRNALPTPEVTGGRQGPAPAGISTWNQGPHHSSNHPPPTPASGASSHLSCQPQGLCTHCFPLHLPASPQQLLPSLTSTPGPLCILFFLHTTVQPFTITPTLLAPQNGIHPWGSQLTLHHRALSSASDSGCLFSVCLGIYFILPIRS